jgi:hypothetical protein
MAKFADIGQTKSERSAPCSDPQLTSFPEGVTLTLLLMHNYFSTMERSRSKRANYHNSAVPLLAVMTTLQLF